MEVNIDLKDEIDEIIRVQNGWCYPSVRPSLVQTVDPLLAPDWTATAQPSAATLLLSSVECSSLCEIVFPSHSDTVPVSANRDLNTAKADGDDDSDTQRQLTTFRKVHESSSNIMGAQSAIR